MLVPMFSQCTNWVILDFFIEQIDLIYAALAGLKWRWVHHECIISEVARKHTLVAAVPTKARDEMDTVVARLDIDNEHESGVIPRISTFSSSASLTMAWKCFNMDVSEEEAISLCFFAAPLVFVQVCLPLPWAGMVLVARLSTSCKRYRRSVEIQLIWIEHTSALLMILISSLSLPDSVLDADNSDISLLLVKLQSSRSETSSISRGSNEFFMANWADLHTLCGTRGTGNGTPSPSEFCHSCCASWCIQSLLVWWWLQPRTGWNSSGNLIISQLHSMIDSYQSFWPLAGVAELTFEESIARNWMMFE